MLDDSGKWLTPEWPAPVNIQAVITTRLGGVSNLPYAAFNLGDHVGDDPAAVARNRSLLVDRLGLPSEPYWLEQVHGCDVVQCGTESGIVSADAAVTQQPGDVCAVMTADCLPLLVTNRSGSCVAAVHAGWRGLADGVVEAAVRRFPDAPAELLVWMGPAIGPDAFEVGDEVREMFLRQNTLDEAAFRPSGAGHWMADIYQLAKRRLDRIGVGYIGGGGLCTYTDSDRFFSYRRDGVTGRMVSLIWME